MAVLQRWYDPARGRWRTAGWWNAANALTTTVAYTARSGDDRYWWIVERTHARHRRGGFRNAFFDDEGWWALAWAAAFELAGEARYLATAEALFADMAGGWDGVCGGGMWWTRKREYKNAITSELFLALAARLHLLTGRESYLVWARRAWRWFAGSGLVNERHLVNDGLTAGCANNGGVTWSYNQGVILGGLCDLARASGDRSLLVPAEAIAGAALRFLTDEQGILREPDEPPGYEGDRTQFKGIFVRNLAALWRATGNPAYRAAIERNAGSLWARARSGACELGFRWAGPFDRADASRQGSALDALVAMLG